MYIIFILQSYYDVAERDDYQITDFIRHKEDDYYLDIRSIFIFERLFFRHCSYII